MLVCRLLKLMPARCVVREPPGLVSSATCNHFRRNFADTPKKDLTRQVMVHGTEDNARVRVRRAFPADTARVIRFVKDNARLAWPGFVSAPNAPNQIILSDYVARTLAQGHTMLAEQQVEKRGWSNIRGLALSACVCPWDAALLETWARCVQCTRARKLLLFTAHCLRAPALHDKYRVHNILQVFLMVPPNVPKCEEIVQMLARNTIQRGRVLGFSLLRFDVTDEAIAKALEGLQLKKEYEFNYEILPNVIKLYNADINNKETETPNTGKVPQITVYTSFPMADAET
ncbi:uncharacterized protein LOC123866499 [Maniola jurtina]|uniref:uncharacterized protein LOC123866499 n=1 Tax=Maniola jurtina TaxID=191418 RepID=UPI001E6891FC|nr:uncharacterized protein LOC123866499 [Maniola jurtina]